MKHLLLASAFLAPLPALAHPHIFINAGVDVIFDDQGRVTHLRVTWAYDDFYSLLLAEDFGMDQDGDGALTPEEEAQLAGFDANWVPGFNGDLVATVEGQPLKLSGPLEPTARMVMGQIVSTHLREVTGTPVLGGDALSLKVFDETYYTAYDITLPVTLVGAPGCKSDLIVPDIDAAQREMQDLLAALDADADLEALGVPNMGEAFASEIRVTCPGS